MNINDSATALRIFREAASLHGEATMKGDYKTCNKCAHQITKAVAFLDGNSERLLLLDFYKDSSVGVRLWASSYLLSLHEKESLGVLEEISKMNGIGQSAIR